MKEYYAKSVIMHPYNVNVIADPELGFFSSSLPSYGKVQIATHHGAPDWSKIEPAIAIYVSVVWSCHVVPGPANHAFPAIELNGKPTMLIEACFPCWAAQTMHMMVSLDRYRGV